MINSNLLKPNRSCHVFLFLIAALRVAAASPAVGPMRQGGIDAEGRFALMQVASTRARGNLPPNAFVAPMASAIDLSSALSLDTRVEFGHKSALTTLLVLASKKDARASVPQVVGADRRRGPDLLLLMVIVGLCLAGCLCVYCFFVHCTSRTAAGDGHAYDSAFFKNVFDGDTDPEEERDGSTFWMKADVQLEPNVFGSVFASTEYLMLTGDGCKNVSRLSHCFGMCVLAGFALLLQFTFAGWMIKAIAQDDYKEKFNVSGNWSREDNHNQFWDWRSNEADGNQTSDDGKPWAFWACTGSDWTWEESKIDEYKKYNAEVSFDSVRNLIPGTFNKGELFGMVAIFLWSASVVKAFRSVAAYMMLMLPGAEVTEIQIESQSTSSPRVLPVCMGTKGLTFVLGLVRTLAICLLWFEGSKFLAFTDNLKDFILNTVALQFVIDIPDILFMAFASNVDKKALERFQEKASITAWIPKKMWQTSATIAVSITVMLTLVGCNYLFGFSHNLWNGVLRQLCAKSPMDQPGPNENLTNIQAFRNGELLYKPE